jgi:hypothetical protein
MNSMLVPLDRGSPKIPLYSTFTPQIQASGRQITTEDLERDNVIAQRIRLFGWVSETHLDIPTGENNEGFLNFAQQGTYITTLSIIC